MAVAVRLCVQPVVLVPAQHRDLRHRSGVALLVVAEPLRAVTARAGAVAVSRLLCRPGSSRLGSRYR